MNEYDLVLEHLEISLAASNENSKIEGLTLNKKTMEWEALVSISSNSFYTPLFWKVDSIDFENQAINLTIKSSDFELLTEQKL